MSDSCLVGLARRSDSDAVNIQQEQGFLATLAAEGEDLVTSDELSSRGLEPRSISVREVSRAAVAERRAVRAVVDALRHDSEIAVAAARRAGQEVGEKRAAARIQELEAAVVAGEKHLAVEDMDRKASTERRVVLEEEARQARDRIGELEAAVLAGERRLVSAGYDLKTSKDRMLIFEEESRRAAARIAGLEAAVLAGEQRLADGEKKWTTSKDRMLIFEEESRRAAARIAGLEAAVLAGEQRLADGEKKWTTSKDRMLIFEEEARRAAARIAGLEAAVLAGEQRLADGEKKWTISAAIRAANAEQAAAKFKQLEAVVFAREAKVKRYDNYMKEARGDLADMRLAMNKLSDLVSQKNVVIRKLQSENASLSRGMSEVEESLFQALGENGMTVDSEGMVLPRHEAEEATNASRAALGRRRTSGGSPSVIPPDPWDPAVS